MIQGNLFAVPASAVPASTLHRFDCDALGFVIAYARQRRGQQFNSEELICAAMERGIAPADGRAWGPVFSAAHKAGYIVPAGMMRRASSHGSMRPAWKGV